MRQRKCVSRGWISFLRIATLRRAQIPQAYCICVSRLSTIPRMRFGACECNYPSSFPYIFAASLRTLVCSGSFNNLFAPLPTWAAPVHGFTRPYLSALANLGPKILWAHPVDTDSCDWVRFPLLVPNMPSTHCARKGKGCTNIQDNIAHKFFHSLSSVLDLKAFGLDREYHHISCMLVHMCPSIPSRVFGLWSSHLARRWTAEVHYISEPTELSVSRRKESSIAARWGNYRKTRLAFASSLLASAGSSALRP